MRQNTLSNAANGHTTFVQVNAAGYHLAAGGANKLQPGVSYAAGWLMEFLLTAALVYVDYAATDNERGRDTAHIPVRIHRTIECLVFCLRWARLHAKICRTFIMLFPSCWSDAILERSLQKA